MWFFNLVMVEADNCLMQKVSRIFRHGSSSKGSKWSVEVVIHGIEDEEPAYLKVSSSKQESLKTVSKQKSLRNFFPRFWILIEFYNFSYNQNFFISFNYWLIETKFFSLVRLAVFLASIPSKKASDSAASFFPRLASACEKRVVGFIIENAARRWQLTLFGDCLFFEIL